MNRQHGFRIDIAAQRRKLRGLESQSSRQADLWCCVKRLARENPRENPWLLPFVALIDERPEDIANARAAIDRYLAVAEEKGSRGHLFNIWCFAFPHCRWAIWFDMMRAAGYYSADEVASIAAKFILIQFRDHHSGLLVKPFPETVDNQAAALALSSYVVGALFAEGGPGEGHLARKMRDEAAPRLETMIGGMPCTGYSGEGSTYQGLIVAFAVPFLTQALESLRGEDLFDAPLRPNGTSPRKILEMTRRMWMPGGLLLPWDDYGYQFGITFPLAYLAHRTGDPASRYLLEHVANYSRITITSSGWGYDQPVWTLVYWPENNPGAGATAWAPWAEEKLGAVLVDPAGKNYLMQMWDPAQAMCVRNQVNPNSLILARNGIPFSADGSLVVGSTTLNYDGAFFERTFGAGVSQRLNLSKGCAGSHNVILVDGNEGLRPPAGETHAKLVAFDPAGQSVVGDVSDLYASVYADCRVVRRRSRLIEHRFWVVEDLIDFTEPHVFTSRWWFRPEVAAMPGGVEVQTPEGARLQLRCVLGNDKATVTRVEGFPKEPDGCSDRVDFQQLGRQSRWLYVLWPTDTVELVRELRSGWEAFPVDQLDVIPSVSPGQTQSLDPGLPPWFQQDGVLSPNWAYRIEVDIAGLDSVLLRLPRGVGNQSRLWLNDVEHPLHHASADKLLPQLVDCTAYLKRGSQLRVTIAMTLATGQDEKGSTMSFPDQPVALCRRIPSPDALAECRFANGTLTVVTRAGQQFVVAHTLMET